MVLVEGLGGLLCPLDERTYIADLASDLGYPLLIVVRNALGTINHTLLSIEALRARSIPLIGIAFIGDEVADTQRTIVDFSGVRQLGRLPLLDRLTGETLRDAMVAGFDLALIAGGD